MKLKSIALIAVVMIVSSCGIGDLEDRVGKIENALGTNEPLTVKFATTNNNNDAIVDNSTYLFKPGGDGEYMGKYTDGDEYVDVYIERFSDVEWYEGAWINFTYNVTTKEITDAEGGTYFTDQFGSDRSYNFYSWASENTTTIKVNSINLETGVVDVSLESSSTAAYQYNAYQGKPMNLEIKFKGKLPVFDWN